MEPRRLATEAPYNINVPFWTWLQLHFLDFFGFRTKTMTMSEQIISMCEAVYPSIHARKTKKYKEMTLKEKFACVQVIMQIMHVHNRALYTCHAGHEFHWQLTALYMQSVEASARELTSVAINLPDWKADSTTELFSQLGIHEGSSEANSIIIQLRQFALLCQKITSHVEIQLANYRLLLRIVQKAMRDESNWLDLYQTVKEGGLKAADLIFPDQINSLREGTPLDDPFRDSSRPLKHASPAPKSTASSDLTPAKIRFFADGIYKTALESGEPISREQAYAEMESCLRTAAALRAKLSPPKSALVIRAETPPRRTSTRSDTSSPGDPINVRTPPRAVSPADPCLVSPASSSTESDSEPDILELPTP